MTMASPDYFHIQSSRDLFLLGCVVPWCSYNAVTHQNKEKGK